MTTSSSGAPSLASLSGTIVLVGAGKMGGAMLEGWLSLGLDPKSVIAIEPQPTPELTALIKRGLRLNPVAAMVDAAALVIAVKPQVAPMVMLSAKSYVNSKTVVLSIMAGTTLAVLERACHHDRDRARDAEHAGFDRPRHHRRGAEPTGRAAPAPTGRRAVGGDRRGRMDRRRERSWTR